MFLVLLKVLRFLLLVSLFYQAEKPCLIFGTAFLYSVSLPFYFHYLICNGIYLNLLNVAAFTNKCSSNKASLSVKNSYLPTFPNNKAKILAVCLSKSY